MHVELNANAGLKALLSENKPKNKLYIQDPMPALATRLANKIDTLPTDAIAREELQQRLAQISVFDALNAGRNKSDDDTTIVTLKDRQVIKGKNGHEDKIIIKKEPHRVFVDTLSRRVNSGLAKGESVDELSKMLDLASDGSLSVHNEVRNIFTALGKLDNKTSEYINRSESYVRLGLEQEAAKIGTDEQLFSFKNKADKALNFSIRTNEGDEIKISLSFNTEKRASDLTYGKAVSLSYEIEGDINSKEQQAFNELLAAVAQSSDALLNGAQFDDLIGLEVFDASQLEGFNLVVDSKALDANQPRNHYVYSYDHDDKNQKVSLTHYRVSESGMRNAVSNMSLHSKIGGSYDEDAIQTLLSVIEQADNVSQHKNNLKDKNSANNISDSSLLSSGIKTFFKTAERLGKALNHANKQLDNSVALAKNMFDQLSEHDPRYQGISDTEKDRIKQGFSLLADHKIKYQQTTGEFNPLVDGHVKETNGYFLKFNQDSKYRAVGDKQALNGSQVSQTRSYKVEAEKVGDTIVRGNVVNDYWRAEERYKINLSSIDSRVMGLDQQRLRDEFRDSFTYSGLGQYVRREEKEQTTASSQIRNVEKLWVEKQSYSSDGYNKLSIYNGRRPEDLDKDQVFGGQYSEQQEKLTLIGDLEKLNENADYRFQKFREVMEVDELMKGKRNQLNFDV